MRERGFVKVVQENTRFFSTFLLILGVIFLIGGVSAAAIQDDLHLNIQVTDASGNVVAGTFDFVFNVTTDSGCSNVAD